MGTWAEMFSESKKTECVFDGERTCLPGKEGSFWKALLIVQIE